MMVNIYTEIKIQDIQDKTPLNIKPYIDGSEVDIINGIPKYIPQNNTEYIISNGNSEMIIELDGNGIIESMRGYSHDILQILYDKLDIRILNDTDNDYLLYNLYYGSPYPDGSLTTKDFLDNCMIKYGFI